MKHVFKSLFVIFCFAAAASAQTLEPSREQKLRTIEELQSQVKRLASEFLQPDAADFARAESENAEVFRILPRQLLNAKVGIREGGAFYSFTTKSHDYDDTPQIGFIENYLGVGFAGADYGFIRDLGEIRFADVNRETAEANFLVHYKPPTNEPEVRVEQRKSREYTANGVTYRNRVPATVGHAYVLRAITFTRADVLVAFKIHRKDSDGSLIIFWKPIETFAKPILARND